MNKKQYFKKEERMKICIVLAALLMLALVGGCDMLNSLFGSYNEGTTPADATTPPAEVTAMNAISGTYDVTLTWTNPTDEDFDNVEICYGKTSIDTDFTGTANPSGTKISGLSSNTEYSFRIKTVDTSGNKSSGKTTTAKTKSIDLSEGAIKIVNSWGKGNDWENKADGHYWITYESLLSLEPIIYFYENNFGTLYEPRMLAVFQVDHPFRDEALIDIVVGDPSAPVAVKSFQSDWGNGSDWGKPIYSGHQPFEDSDGELITMVMDISELIPKIYDEDNKNDVFLRIHNIGTTSGSVKSFSVEYYSDYSKDPFKTIIGVIGDFGSGDTTFKLTIPDLNTFSDSQQTAITTPLSRSSLLNEPVFVMEKPSDEELAADMERYGVYEEGKNYNVVTPLGFGTGLAPMSEEGWHSMKKLRSVELPRNLTASEESVDHSTTEWFPPIGNQGSKNSCVAFSVGYYIHTYTEAREHGWNLSDAEWVNDFYGYPSAYQDQIMSPDFFYHQMNLGGNNGTDTRTAMDIAIRIGGASWGKMPYDLKDYTSWPDEYAFREAAARRGRTIEDFSFDVSVQTAITDAGYFTIDSNESIDLLKRILAAGYCVSTSVRADVGDGSPYIYQLLDINDVVSGYSAGTMDANHANTIVGYKEGSSWDLANPDN